jgi:hypothetical protein
MIRLTAEIRKGFWRLENLVGQMLPDGMGHGQIHA